MKKIIVLLVVCLSAIMFSGCLLPNDDLIAHKNLKQYKLDVKNSIDRVLNEKLTYEHTTFKQMLVKYDNEAEKIYNNKDNLTQNDLEKLNLMSGTISLYPEAICEEFKPLIDKYNLGVVPGAECDIYLYDNFIVKYNIENAKDFKKLLELQRTIYQKINKYENELLNIQ